LITPLTDAATALTEHLDSFGSRFRVNTSIMAEMPPSVGVGRAVLARIS